MNNNRPDIALEKLTKLKPMYGCRAITAGNVFGLNDGARVILFMTREKAEQLGLSPLATIIAMVSIAISPHRMPEGLAYVIQRVLKLPDVG